MKRLHISGVTRPFSHTVHCNSCDGLTPKTGRYSYLWNKSSPKRVPICFHCNETFKKLKPQDILSYLHSLAQKELAERSVKFQSPFRYKDPLCNYRED